MQAPQDQGTTAATAATAANRAMVATALAQCVHLVNKQDASEEEQDRVMKTAREAFAVHALLSAPRLVPFVMTMDLVCATVQYDAVDEDMLPAFIHLVKCLSEVCTTREISASTEAVATKHTSLSAAMKTHASFTIAFLQGILQARGFVVALVHSLTSPDAVQRATDNLVAGIFHKPLRRHET